MMQVTLARRNIVVCALILAVVSGSIILSGWRRTQMLDQLKTYADAAGFNEFLENAQANLESTQTSMKDRVAGYLGNSELIDPHDARPLVADSDPDLAEKYPANDEQEEEEGFKDENSDDENLENLVNLGESEGNAQHKAQGRKAAGMSKAGGKSRISRTTKAAKSPRTATLAGSKNHPLDSAQTASNEPGPSGSDRTPRKIVTVPENPYPEVPDPTKENTKGQMKFRFYSHNVKNGDQVTLAKGELPWETRKRHVINSIKQNTVANTLVFLQEPHKFQIDDIMQDLNLFSNPAKPEWAYFGGGRLDGRTSGEHVPIIYRPSEWTLLYNDTMWLNNGRVRSSILGWDATYPRILTYATLQHRELAQIINVANTHFDLYGSVARRELAALVTEKMTNLNKWPLFVAGDFNAVFDEASVKHIKSHFSDVHDLVPDYNRYGHPDYSVTGFSGKYLAEGKRVDYIFAPHFTKKLLEKACVPPSRPFSVRILGYGLLHSKYGGVYMSDHRPVMADFVMKGCGALA